MAQLHDHEFEIRKKILEEMIAKVAASIRQYERTLEGLRQRIEAERRLYELLEQRRDTTTPHDQLETALSVADCVAKVLLEEGEPMHVRDIARALQKHGISTNSENGPLNSVMSALSRRADLFERISRGRYALRSEVEHRNRVTHSHQVLEEVHS